MKEVSREGHAVNAVSGRLNPLEGSIANCFGTEVLTYPRALKTLKTRLHHITNQEIGSEINNSFYRVKSRAVLQVPKLIFLSIPPHRYVYVKIKPLCPTAVSKPKIDSLCHSHMRPAPVPKALGTDSA